MTPVTSGEGANESLLQRIGHNCLKQKHRSMQNRKVRYMADACPVLEG